MVVIEIHDYWTIEQSKIGSYFGYWIKWSIWLKLMAPILFLFLSVANRKFSILYVPPIFLLDGVALYNTLTEILEKRRKEIYSWERIKHYHSFEVIRLVINEWRDSNWHELNMIGEKQQS